MSTPTFNPQHALRLDGCDPQALVDISQQFIRLDLDLDPSPPSTEDLPHASTSSRRDKADWTAVAGALGSVYQALCNNECNAALNALRAIERILTKRGIVVQQPTMTSHTTPEDALLPIEAEFDYGD